MNSKLEQKKIVAARNKITSIIRQRRMQLNLSQAKLAEKCGVSTITINRSEQKNSGYPGTKELLNVLFALDLTITIQPSDEKAEYIQSLMLDLKKSQYQ